MDQTSSLDLIGEFVKNIFERLDLARIRMIFHRLLWDESNNNFSKELLNLLHCFKAEDLDVKTSSELLGVKFLFTSKMSNDLAELPIYKAQ